MSCPGLETVSAYHDGELPEGEGAQLRAHLEQCEDCRRFLAELRGISGSLQAIAPPLSQGVPPLSTKPLPWWKRSVAIPLPLVANLALIFVLILGFWWSRRSAEPPQQNIEQPDKSVAAGTQPPGVLSGYDSGGRAVILIRPRLAGEETRP